MRYPGKSSVCIHMEDLPFGKMCDIDSESECENCQFRLSREDWECEMADQAYDDLQEARS